MKSNIRKRIIAFMLCMVMVISCGTSAMADETGANLTENAEAAAKSQAVEEPAQQEQLEEAPQQEVVEEEPVQEVIEEEPKQQVGEEEPQEEPQEENTQPSEGAAVPYEKLYEDEKVTIKVNAEAGIVPENAELSVTPIVKKDITDSMTAEEKAETEAINDEYDFTSEKLAEDSDKKNEIMEGFLAYDISFMVDGEEIEPSGTVDVVMEFKEAVAPEGISEEATVSVKHLKENENEVVVEDLSDKAEVHTTDKVEVQKVEMKSDSFSTFTLTWGNYAKITVKYVDTKGNLIQHSEFQSGNINISGTNWATLSEYATQKEVTIGDKTYKYKEARLDTYQGKVVAGVRYYNGVYRYRTGTGNGYNWDGSGAQEVYLIYKEVKTLTPVETIDSSAKGIKMKMIDYDGAAFPGGTWQQSKNVKQGLLSKTLNEDGYPSFINNKWGVPSGGSLKQHYKGGIPANHLFLKEVYDDQGNYFYYNSEENAATYDTNEGKFTVYSELVTPLNQDYPFYNRGNFLPYTTFNKMTESSNKNKYDAAGEMLDKNHPRYEEALYLPDGDAGLQFGMELSASFIQTKGGMYDEAPIKYEFTGDDDLWLYIDGVLVLDMGGCHDARSGHIDFSNGEVYVQGVGMTTIKELFEAAGKAGSVKWKGNTFADFTRHKFNMWYMERGGGASNLKIKFNMPVIPEESVNVAKIVQNQDGTTVDYAEDIDFHFNIKVGGENYSNEPYEILYNESSTGKTATTDENGNFTLKHLETARFSGIKADQKYQVTETGAYMGGYDVTVEDTVLTIIGPEGNEEKIGSAATPDLVVGEKPYIAFTNTVKNTAILSINKTLKDGSKEALKDKMFPVILKINGTVYKNNYDINGTTQTATDGIIILKADETATITGLPYGATVEVEEQMDGSYLPTYSIDGTIYEIVRPEYNADGILTNGVTTISGKVAGNCNVTIENEAIKMGTGTTSVTVKKTWQDSEEYAGLIPKSLKVTLYEDVNHNQEFDEEDQIVTGITSTVQLTPDPDPKKAWTHTWSGLPGDKDFVVVEECPEGFKQLETTIENDITDVEKIGKKVTPNSSTKFNLGENNFLLVKTTGNDAYFLWTAYDLKLSDEEIVEIATRLEGNLDGGSGNFNPQNVRYEHGDVGGTIALTQTKDGWQLKFLNTSIWSMFWRFTYSRVENIELTNTIDKDQKIAIDVNKVWGGDTPETRPGKITIQLYEKLNEDLILGEAVIQPDSDGNWKHQFENLPKYGMDSNGKYYTIEYGVKETKIGDADVDENGCAANYQSSVNENEDGSFTITNTRQWQIIKISANSTEADKLVLAGAVFRLARQGEVSLESNIWGKSDENGIVKWYDNQGCTTEREKAIQDGIYELSEFTSPQGYMVSEETWTVEIVGGAPTKIRSYKDAQYKELKSEEVAGKNTYYYENEIVYSLPSTGGTGIYWYIIGGMLLMIAAALILYKSKGGEVLKR